MSLERERQLTPGQVAARLQVSVEHVYRLIEAGRLPASNVGAGTTPRWRIAESSLELLRVSPGSAK
jgi:excisionase family DNA binding protein